MMNMRYGNDSLNRSLLGLSLVLFVVSLFGSNLYYLMALLIMLVVCFRMFSKQIEKRASENRVFLQYHNRIIGCINFLKPMGSYTKAERIYVCPMCKQKIRVPKGKGRIAITCKKCGCEFVKNCD